MICSPKGQTKRHVVEALQEIEHRAVLVTEQPRGDEDSVLGRHADEMLIKSAMVDRAQAEAVRHGWVASLRDVGMAQWAEAEHLMPDVVRRRARHVVTEDDRVNRFVDACGRGDLELMGRLLGESHRSLQHDYEVSCEELDFLVDQALTIEGVFGARMTGGGFGGCTVNMMRPESVDHFRGQIARVRRSLSGDSADLTRAALGWRRGNRYGGGLPATPRVTVDVL